MFEVTQEALVSRRQVVSCQQFGRQFRGAILAKALVLVLQSFGQTSLVTLELAKELGVVLVRQVGVGAFLLGRHPEERPRQEEADPVLVGADVLNRVDDLAGFLVDQGNVAVAGHDFDD